MKISLTYLGTRNSKFRLNLTQRVTGSLVGYKNYEVTGGVINMENTTLIEPIQSFSLFSTVYVFNMK